MNKTHMDKRLNQLPTWLWTNSTTLPPIYKMVWEAVREDKVRTNGMQPELLVDTNKVFPLLLTSQLPTEVLGHIWNLANQKYAGQLTEQELYIVLALVAAAQASYTFNSLDILHLLPFPPTPYLNIECLMNLQPVTQLNSAAKFQNFQANTEFGFIGPDERYSLEVKGKMKLHQQGVISSDLNVQMTNNVPGKISCFDNKSYVSSTTIWDSNNVLKDTKQTPRSQLDFKHSSSTDLCDDFSEFQSAPIPNIPNIPIWDTKQGSAIGSRLANHNLGVKKPMEKSKKNNINSKSAHGTTQTRITSVPLIAMSQSKDQSTLDCLSELFPKCTIKNQSKTVILKDTVIRNNDPPKDHSENVKEYTNIEIVNLTNDKDVLNKSEWVEKALPATLETTQQDLMNLQLVEDKYSALRALVQETTVSTEPISNASYNNQSTDEFGEFVSAEQPAVNTPATNTVDTDSFADIFTDFEFKSSNNNNANTADFNLMPDISESFDNLKLEDNVEERSLEIGKTLQKEDAISINSIEFMNGASNALTRSGSVPSLDLKSFLPSNTEDEQIMDTTHQSEYWEWKQYMESCVLLLQVAVNIFTNISSELILHEVLNSAQGYNFLCNLAEVAAVCRRVNFSYKEMDINIIGFDELLMDIDRIWAEMEPFYANIPIVTELPAWPLHQGEAICCSLCLTVITSGRVVYNENSYHVTCANLWINCINNNLPVMRHPVYSHSNICPGNNHI
ncbi:Synergin gamma [Eufriesea mexicana]|uniref:synergin gamma-like n=1 Tax=Eufriesea mexicana TaxID=516756 RepID=UPI00083C22D8|nr:PREDICTED: synergin gamma-like [Eufriesea mexicana]OAD60150.1 Synergin gamma [Eufriesea mexicana]